MKQVILPTIDLNKSHTPPHSIILVTVINEILIVIVVVVQVEHAVGMALPVVVVVHQRLTYVCLLNAGL